MLLVAARDFRDLSAGVTRRAGEAFEATAERYEELRATEAHGRLAYQVVGDDKPKAKQKAKKQEA